MLHFVSLNREWITEIQRLFPDATASCCDIQNILTENTLFVSPANCLGFMDGGIDFVYSRKMFPGCEQQVRKKIIEIGYKTLLGRPYLPIGSAFCVSVGESAGLVCAPTMFLPHDVSKTRNAYLSFLAALINFKKIGKYSTLVVTSHCCGYGKMTEIESARQMREAYDDFLDKKYPVDASTDINIVRMPLYDHEQPDNYDNREIKEVPIEKIMMT